MILMIMTMIMITMIMIIIKIMIGEVELRSLFRAQQDPQ